MLKRKAVEEQTLLKIHNRIFLKSKTHKVTSKQNCEFINNQIAILICDQFYSHYYKIQLKYQSFKSTMIQRLATTSITQSSRMIQRNAYTFLPPSCYQISNKPNPVLAVTLGNSQSNLFTLKFRLFENTVPKTSENFKRLLLGNASYLGNHLSLIGTGIKRHVPGAFIEMGHMEQGKNCSIFGPTFRDQSFELLHDRAGLLSSVSNQNTNSSPFLITLAPCRFLDYKNVIFGQIDPESMQSLRNLEREIKKYSDLRISAVQELIQQVKHHDHGHHH